MPPAAEWSENRPSRGWLPSIGLRMLWRRRELARFLALRDLQLRYKQTFFGVAWAVLQPLAAMGILALTLGRVADIPSDGLPYAVFVYSGLAIWFFVAHAVSSAAESLTDDPDLVTKVWFPRLLAPIAAIASWFVDLAVSLVVVAVLLAVNDITPGIQLITLPLWLAAGVMVSLGVGLWMSALNVLYRDVRYTLGLFLQVWFLASPVIYSAATFDGFGRALLALNPLCGVLDGVRWALVDGPVPPAIDLLSAVSGVLVLASGVIFFRRTERRFADRI